MFVGLERKGQIYLHSTAQGSMIWRSLDNLSGAESGVASWGLLIKAGGVRVQEL